MYVEGKDLKSKCNSCGKLNSHDIGHKAGKELAKFLNSGGKNIVDITQKDKSGADNSEDDDEEENKEKKKVKKEKKDKKKKEDKDGEDDNKKEI